MANYNKIFVYFDNNVDPKIKVGVMHIERIKGKEIISFQFDESFFKSPLKNQFFDYDLLPINSRQYLPNHKNNFGCFSDASPDRWGRTLIKRKARLLFDPKEKGKAPSLTEIDYLIGVYDEGRMGALRFSIVENGEYLSNDKEDSTPPFKFLRTLEQAAIKYEEEQNLLEDKWINILIAPGSSLGGARPKATVKDVDGSLWIAKFPSKNDSYNLGAWEKTAMDLAKLCSLNTPETKLMKLSKSGSTFLVKRFDRVNNKRIHFMSAMTALGKIDGDNASKNVSYLDIASFISSYGYKPKEDLKELWKRIIFSICISNTDDHLRNHGFILTEKGWELSPIYDINPNIDKDSLSLNIDSNDNSLSTELAISVSEYFDIEKDEAQNICNQIKNIIIENWEKVAIANGISKYEIEYMRPAFIK